MSDTPREQVLRALSTHCNCVLMLLTAGFTCCAVAKRRRGMEERDFYDERQEMKKATLSCPHCHQSGEYDWAGSSAPSAASCRPAPTSATVPSSPRRAPIWCGATIWWPARTLAAASASKSRACSRSRSWMSRSGRRNDCSKPEARPHLAGSLTDAWLRIPNVPAHPGQKNHSCSASIASGSA
jgi:hypothetical protein